MCRINFRKWYLAGITLLRNAATAHLHGIVLRINGGHVYEKMFWVHGRPISIFIHACRCSSLSQEWVTINTLKQTGTDLLGRILVWLRVFWKSHHEKNKYAGYQFRGVMCTSSCSGEEMEVVRTDEANKTLERVLEGLSLRIQGSPQITEEWNQGKKQRGKL